LYNKIKVEDKIYKVAHTHAHGWIPESKRKNTTEETDKENIALKKFGIMIGHLKNLDDLILCGDFNTPRGEKIFDTLATMYTDNIPLDITNTLDQKLHPMKGPFDVVIDCFFT
jgi:endonuclease/exonuclease/phosphatase family metal-dependent hydrolase